MRTRCLSSKRQLRQTGPGVCRLGQNGCIACRKAKKSRKSNFCKFCEVSVMRGAPAIVEIAEENETFKSGVFALPPIPRPGRLIFGVVVQQFQSSWRDAAACPTVHAVYQIVFSQQSMDKYNSYRHVVFPSPNPKRDTHCA